MPDETRLPAPSAQQRLVDELIFRRDINEGFLLIDYISGRSEKSLKDLDTEGLALPGSAPPGPGAPPIPPGQIWEAFCRIRYPPDLEKHVKAENAAFVLQVKDRLNALARPARGITIAYTTIFVGTTGWRRQTDEQQTLLTQAVGAFPNINQHARCFALFFGWILPCYMLLCFLATAFTYWDVAYGGTIVQTLQQLESQRTALQQSYAQSANSITLSKQTCASAMPAGADPAQLRSACARLAPLDNLVDEARQDLQGFYQATISGHSPYNPIARLRPMRLGFLAYSANLSNRANGSHGSAEPTGAGANEPGSANGLNGASSLAGVDEQSIIWVLTLFGTYVLPAMFGVLGTTAAIVRAVQSKMRDSLLSPRDFSLSLLGLLTGPLAGLAVGLFYTPSATAAQSAAGLAGTVTLTVSGLGFLAGYGADAFFKFLDALLVRVFALDENNRGK